MLKPEVWKNRLNCAWNMFTSQLRKLKLHSGAFLNNKVDILPGQSSYDVNSDAEEEFNNNIFQKQQQQGNYYKMKDGGFILVPRSEKRNMYSHVRKMTVKVGERMINFVDFNSAVLLCMSPGGKVSYDKCAHHKDYQLNKWGFTKALEYYTTLVNVLKKLEAHAWNVMRAHHAPANYIDGDVDFYWAKLMDNQSLMDLFKLKKVRMFFGAHLKGQAVISVPYKDNLMREKATKGQSREIKKMGAFCNEGNLKFEAMTNGNNGLLTDRICQKYTAFVIDTLKEDVLLVFINGNSGRAMDPIYDGALSSHGNIVWARRNKLNDGRDAFGFANVMFRVDDVQFEFYELFDTKQQVYECKKVAEFKITEYKKVVQ